MKTIAKLSIVAIVLLALAMPAFAEEDTPPEVVAALPIPAVLLGLMALNNRVTESVKLYLASDKLPFTPEPSLRQFLTLIASMLIGIVSAAVTPDALSWLGTEFNAYPVAAIVVTGVSVSLGAGAMQMVLSILQGFRPAAPSTVTTSGDGTTNITVMPTAPEKLEAVG